MYKCRKLLKYTQGISREKNGKNKISGKLGGTLYNGHETDGVYMNSETLSLYTQLLHKIKEA